MLKASAALITALLLSANPAETQSLTDTYTSFIVLGDSTSDPGNLNRATGGAIAGPPYFNGRFSNGPVWADYIADDFFTAGLPSLNLAFGNARATSDFDGIPDLADQVAFLPDFLDGTLAAIPLGDRPLGVVFFGANDLYFAETQPDPEAVARQAAADIRASIAPLAALGITDFVLANSGDIGTTPRFNVFGNGDPAVGRAATLAFNAALEAPITPIAGVNDISLFDFFGLAETVIADPAAFGITETILPCFFDDAAVALANGRPDLCAPADEDSFLFFDSVHPSAVAHIEIANVFRSTVGASSLLAPVPLPSAAWGLLLGLGALLAVRRVRAT